MGKSFYPDFTFSSIETIDPDFFKKQGIQFLILDIDNTLVGDNEPYPDERALAFLERLKRENIVCTLVSNNHRERVASFNQNLGLPAFHRAAKPLPFRLRRAMRDMGAAKENTAFIGDQLFTDMMAGNWAGVTTILVNPINEKKENRFFKLKRALEKKVYERQKGNDHV